MMGKGDAGNILRDMNLNSLPCPKLAALSIPTPSGVTAGSYIKRLPEMTRCRLWRCQCFPQKLVQSRSFSWRGWDTEKHYHCIKRSFDPWRPRPSWWERTAVTIHNEYCFHQLHLLGFLLKGWTLNMESSRLRLAFKRNQICSLSNEVLDHKRHHLPGKPLKHRQILPVFTRYFLNRTCRYYTFLTIRQISGAKKRENI